MFRFTELNSVLKTSLLGAKNHRVHLKFRVYLRNLGLRLISPIEVIQ